MEVLDQLDLRVLSEVPDLRVLPALRAARDHRDLLDPSGNLVPGERTVNKEILDHQGSPDNQAP